MKNMEGRQRDREKQRGKGTERQRDRETERQRDRETERLTAKKTETERQRHRDIETQRVTESKRQTERGRETPRKRDQIDRKEACVGRKWGSERKLCCKDCDGGETGDLAQHDEARERSPLDPHRNALIVLSQF